MKFEVDSKHQIDWLSFRRDVRFGDSDGAGVVHFHQLFRWAHESWEESLQKYGLSSSAIFPCLSNKLEGLKVSLPIIHCNADFRHPIQAGDQLIVALRPEKLDRSCFGVQTKFCIEEKLVAEVFLRHLAIDSKTRQRSILPYEIDLWLEASSLFDGPRPV